MDKISHAEARRLVQSAPGQVSGEESRRLAEHLETCASCRRFAGEMERMERALRRGLREQFDSPPLPPPAYREISARMRANKMKKQIFSIAGAAVILLLLVGLFTNLPAAITQLVGSGARPTGAAPSGDATPEPTQPSAEPFGFQDEYLFLGAQGNRQTLNLASGDLRGRNLLESSPRVTAAAWSPDGQWIAYIDAGGIEPASPGPEVFVMDASGGRVTRLTTASGLDWSGPLAWSPDGRWLAAAARPLDGQGATKLYLIALDGSGAHALGDTQGAQYPRWSPEGKFLAFTREENGLPALYAFQVQDNYAYKINARPGGELAAQGRYAVARDGLYTWLNAPEGGPADAVLAYLAEGPYDDTGEPMPGAQGALILREGIETPRVGDAVRIRGLAVGAVTDLSLSPDQAMYALAFEYAGRDCGSLQFYANGEGGATIDVASLCPTARPGGLSWSADSRWLLVPGVLSGRQAVFAVLAAPSEPAAGIDNLLLGPAGYDAIQAQARTRGADLGITPAANAVTAAPEMPSVDLQAAPGQLLFSASAEPVTPGLTVTHLYVARPDGSDLRRLFEEEASQYSLALSPDGAALAFLRQEGYVPGVPYAPARPYLLRLGESAPLPLIDQEFPTTYMKGESEPEREPRPGDILFPLYGTPVWSPDGGSLAFSVMLDGGAASKIAVVPADGSRQARYTDVAFSAEGGPAPRWSPDGRWLVFSLGEYGQGDLYLLDASGGAEPANLTQTPDRSEGNGAIWSPDGQRLAYFARDTDPQTATEVRLIQPDGSGTRRLASYAAEGARNLPFLYDLQWSPDGRYASYAVNDSQSYGRQRFQLMLTDPQSGDSRALLTLDEGLNTYAWSPDGQWLAYSTDSGLWVANVAETLASQSAPVRISELSGVWSLQWRKHSPEE